MMDNIACLRDDLIAKWFDDMVDLLRWYDQRRCRRRVKSTVTLREIVRRVPSLSLPCFISKRNYDCDRINYWICRAVKDYVKRRCDRMAWENHYKSGSSEILVDCFLLVTRRTALATLDAWHRNEHDIVESRTMTTKTMTTTTTLTSTTVRTDDETNDHEEDCETSNYDDIVDYTDTDNSDNTGSEDNNVELDPGNTARNELYFINDDPWCSELTLIIGGVYRFIGQGTKLISKDTLLRLIAFLPCDDNQRTVSPYVCDPTDTIEPCCDAKCVKRKSSHENLAQSFESLECANEPAVKSGSTIKSSKLLCGETSLTKGCGLPTNNDRAVTHFDKFPRLLMRKLVTRDDDDTSSVWNAKDMIVVSRGTFTLNRCNSVWTKNMYTFEHKRDGMVLFGYPLVLNCGVSTWRVQGETIPRSDMYIDFKYMSKQQALVALSRVRRNEQICGVLNLNAYGVNEDR